MRAAGPFTGTDGSCRLLRGWCSRLKHTRPGMSRPFNIRGGTPLAVLVAFLPFAISCANVYFAVTDDTFGKSLFRSCYRICCFALEQHEPLLLRLAQQRQAQQVCRV